MVKSHQFKNAEQLIKVYVPDAEELALNFVDLYFITFDRDEAAARALKLDCGGVAESFIIRYYNLRELTS